MASRCVMIVLILAFVHASTARNVPADHATLGDQKTFLPCAAAKETNNIPKDEQIFVHASAPSAESPTGLKDKKNFIYGGVGGFAGMGGYAGVVGGLPVLGGLGGIGKFGGIGGVGGIGGIGGLGTGGLAGLGGIGGGAGGAGGAAGGAGSGGADGSASGLGGGIFPRRP